MIMFNVWKNYRFFRVIWQNMISVSLKVRAILRMELVSYFRKMFKYFIWANSERFELFEKLTGLKFVCITKVLRGSCFKWVVSNVELWELSLWFIWR